MKAYFGWQRANKLGGSSFYAARMGLNGIECKMIPYAVIDDCEHCFLNGELCDFWKNIDPTEEQGWEQLSENYSDWLGLASPLFERAEELRYFILHNDHSNITLGNVGKLSK
ncbi:MAG: hypothetical protein Pg6B_09730 [Candidatus Azobacteroides pseudotrichonymphae]|jgi:hypothetical protein|uniref:Uncharacterized protein n=1 Tax=Azobacteroides pseudotrichonymphae genomovar. CFP2 TaxID=511995 RepID=B6YRY6_AZOPC|nr:hypothetical protein [Candidatus Azobacteroides pseudotrichonymphae]BAG83958.1 hypothetical protein CFPG_695 [Candidatus Azobacteroides pseudotrichonymphae genomovar. CFP2]GMO37830.1 MAG: hypothetical protein Pg6B_09730 [Candidatus Azobacteroides pseudotrichonymphae]